MKKESPIRRQLLVIGLIVTAGIVFNSCSKLQNNAVLASVSCNSCHGSSLNAAPPSDLSGNTSTSDPEVGAHQIHLSGSSFAEAVTCSSCHIVPQSVGPGIHPDGPGAATLIFFSGVAVTQTNTPGGYNYDSIMVPIVPTPTFNDITFQCSNTYCHGNFKGGNNFSPNWTILDGSQDSCGSCHGLPPNDATHQGKGITLQTCYYCHSPMIGQDGTILDNSMHVTGKLELFDKSVTAW
ncbi:MAG: CxxxxCH/CxxCH domain c-type cytochrome [Candidatus Kryptoniota bacterium]